MRLPHPGEMSVDPATGAFKYMVEDLSIPCRGGMELTIERYANSLSEHGFNSQTNSSKWSFNFQERLRFEYRGDVGTPLQPGWADVVVLPSSTGASAPLELKAISVIYPDLSSERFVYQDGAFVAAVSKTLSTLTQDGEGSYVVATPSIGSHHFGSDGYLTGIADLYGNRITFTWMSHPLAPDRRIPSTIVDPAGRTLTFSFENSTMIIRDWIDREWQYVFEDSEVLRSFRDPDGNVTTYRYGTDAVNQFDQLDPGFVIPSAPDVMAPSQLLPLVGLYKVTFPNGDFVTNYSFNARPMAKRVGVQIFGGRMAVNHSYDLANRKTIKLVGDSDSRTTYQFDSLYRTTSVTDALGNATSYAYSSAGDLTGVTDPRLATTLYEYDSRHRVTKISGPTGYQTAFEYHPVLDEVSAITGPVPGAQAYTRAYDSATTALTGATDRLGNSEAYTYDEYGHAIRRTRKNGGVDTYAHDPITGSLLSYTNPLGNVTRYSYDEVGRTTSVTTPVGRITRYTYTPSGRLASITDPLGAVTSMDYDGNGNLVKVTDALGNVTQLTYNALNELTSVRDALGNVTSYAYTTRGELMSVTNPKQATTSFTYDVMGRMTKVTDALGQVTQTSYDPYCGTTMTTDALGRTSSVTRDVLCRVTEARAADGTTLRWTYNADGTTSTFTDGRGNVTAMAYDPQGRLSRVTDAIGRTVSLDYDVDGNVIRRTDARGNSTTMTYDLANRLTGTVRRDGTSVSINYDNDDLVVSLMDARGKVWETINDAAGRPVAFVDPLGNRSERTYDAIARLVRLTSPLGREVAYSYDSLGRLVSQMDPLGNTSSFRYDENSNLLETTDPLGRTRSLAYDALDRRIAATDALGIVTQFSFDAVDNLIAFTDANGNTTAYEFDALDRMVSTLYADGSRASGSYDANGNLIAQTDPRGYTTTYEYNNGNQLVAISLPDAAQVALNYDLNGNLVERVDASGTRSFVFDSEDRVLRMLEAGTMTTELSYDANGATTELVYADGTRTTYTRDDAGRLVTLRGPDGKERLYTYDPDGRSTGLIYPTGALKLVQYDAGSRITRLAHQDQYGHKLAPDFRLVHDAAGNVLTVTDDATPMWTFAYDSNDQLISARNHPSNSVTAWTYDPLGNRLSETVDGTTTDYSYNSINQLIQAGATTLTYDAAGNMASKSAPGQVTRYAFDSLNRLTAVDLGASTVRYDYDAAGRMVARQDADGTTRFEWKGWDLVREVTPTGRSIRYLLNGSELAGFQADGTTYHLHSDWLGSVRTVTDQLSTVVASFDYDAWGDALGSSSDNVPGGLPYRFVGALGVRYDTTAGLHYMRNRWYDANIGRFISRDPIGMTAGFNRYSYANRSPLHYIDPAGLQSTNPNEYDPYNDYRPGSFHGSSEEQHNVATAHAEAELRQEAISEGAKGVFSWLPGWAGMVFNSFTSVADFLAYMTAKGVTPPAGKVNFSGENPKDPKEWMHIDCDHTHPINGKDTVPHTHEPRIDVNPNDPTKGRVTRVDSATTQQHADIFADNINSGRWRWRR